ncbi:MAG: carboxypeptidase regulatory-like domain-containing protein [Lachnospiraceae bacterium]|nr:carboxypeptidase regulatory-like domain-containing protein [Lachnospiraceae bacterium]
MKKCIKCGRENGDQMNFCRYCGTALTSQEQTKQTEMTAKGAGASWILPAGIALAAVAAALVVLFIVLHRERSMDAERQVEEESAGTAWEEARAEDMEETVTPVDNGVQAETEQVTGSILLTLVGANEGGVIGDAAVTLRGENREYESRTDGSGQARFTGLQEGRYTISCSADGFYESEHDCEIGMEEMQKLIPMVPQIREEDDACVLLVWEGDRDLDLCAFHSSLKEYVNTGHPIDSEGDIFLYADHGAAERYELLYIHNISDEAAKSIYVAETAKAREGQASEMEREGVSVSVYGTDGIVLQVVADAAEEAPLWRPCYVYAGKFYEDQEYVSDTTAEAYDWLSFHDTDPVPGEEAQEGQARQTDTAAWKDGFQKKAQEEAGDYGEDTVYADLIYADDDDIPEMVLYSGTYMIGVYAWKNGAVQGITDGFDLCEYMPKKGLLLLTAGGYGGNDPEELGHDTIALCRLDQNGFKTIGYGEVRSYTDGGGGYTWHDSVGGVNEDHGPDPFGERMSYDEAWKEFYWQLSKETFIKESSRGAERKYSYTELMEQLK